MHNASRVRSSRVLATYKSPATAAMPIAPTPITNCCAAPAEEEALAAAAVVEAKVADAAPVTEYALDPAAITDVAAGEALEEAAATAPVVEVEEVRTVEDEVVRSEEDEVELVVAARTELVELEVVLDVLLLLLLVLADVVDGVMLSALSTALSTALLAVDKLLSTLLRLVASAPVAVAATLATEASVELAAPSWEETMEDKSAVFVPRWEARPERALAMLLASWAETAATRAERVRTEARMVEYGLLLMSSLYISRSAFRPYQSRRERRNAGLTAERYLVFIYSPTSPPLLVDRRLRVRQRCSSALPCCRIAESMFWGRCRALLVTIGGIDNGGRPHEVRNGRSPIYRRLPTL